MLFFNENDRHCLDFIRTTPPHGYLYFLRVFLMATLHQPSKQKDGFKNPFTKLSQKNPWFLPNVFLRIFRVRHVSNKLTWSCHGEVKPRRAAFKVAAKVKTSR